MYEMYPDAWTATEDRQPPAEGRKPRRRARKEHSVVPAILAGSAGPADKAVTAA